MLETCSPTTQFGTTLTYFTPFLFLDGLACCSAFRVSAACMVSLTSKFGERVSTPSNHRRHHNREGSCASLRILSVCVGGWIVHGERMPARASAKTSHGSSLGVRSSKDTHAQNVLLKCSSSRLVCIFSFFDCLIVLAKSHCVCLD